MASQTPSEIAFQNRLAAQQEEVNTCLRELFRCYATFDRASFHKYVGNLRVTFANLSEFVLNDDFPDWAKHIARWTDSAKEQREESQEIDNLKILLGQKPIAENFSWTNMSNSATTLLDIDKLVMEAEQENHVLKLFDQAIDLAVRLSRNGDIDSIYVRSSLKKVLATLSNAKSRPLLQKRIALEAISRFMKNLSEEFINSAFVAGETFRAFKKTAEELRESIAEAERAVETNSTAIICELHEKRVQQIEKQETKLLEHQTVK